MMIALLRNILLKWVMAGLHLLPAEMAHNLSIRALSCPRLSWVLRLLTHRSSYPHHALSSPSSSALPKWDQEYFGLNFSNPIGLAAGFDKNAMAFQGLAQLGFSFCELGSVTPMPQMGNDKPRLFRLTQDQAIINRMGFNNDGLVAFKRRVKHHYDLVQQSKQNPPLLSYSHYPLLGINLGKNKTTESATSDYEIGAKELSPYCDYMVINISSPNTAGLRALQQVDTMRDILLKTRAAMTIPRPLWIKLAPDLEPDMIARIGEFLSDKTMAPSPLVDGVVMGNTTLSRDGLLSPAYLSNETGGLSGRPLRDRALQSLKLLYQASQGQVPIIGCGGITTGQDAYDRLRAGASLLQIYTAFIYQGINVIPNLLNQLNWAMQQDGFNDIRQIIALDTGYKYTG